jgi:hypothetical protein
MGGRELHNIEESSLLPQVTYDPLHNSPYMDEPHPCLDGARVPTGQWVLSYSFLHWGY